MFGLQHLRNTSLENNNGANPPGSPPSAAEENKEKKKTSRTTGLKVFDAFLYPFFTNFVVFAISVVATYLTSAGDKKDENGKLIYGRIGEIFHERGAWLVNKFKGMGMNNDAAEMAKMVTFSFLDGSLIAPFVKLFEDRREKIGKWIDDKLGTRPKDDSAYEAEPKQSWWSVLGGRFATVSIVVPTAVLLEKLGLNNILFSNPGKKFGEWLEREHPETAKKIFGKLNVPELTKIGFFEAFYTSVCTAGLYFSSRFFAGLKDRNKNKDTATPAPTTEGVKTSAGSDSGSHLLENETLNVNEKPSPKKPSQAKNFSAEALAGGLGL